MALNLANAMLAIEGQSKEFDAFNNCALAMASALLPNDKVRKMISLYMELPVEEQNKYIYGDLFPLIHRLAYAAGCEKTKPSAGADFGLAVIPQGMAPYVLAVSDRRLWYCRVSSSVVQVQSCRVQHAWRLD